MVELVQRRAERHERYEILGVPMVRLGERRRGEDGALAVRGDQRPPAVCAATRSVAGAPAPRARHRRAAPAGGTSVAAEGADVPEHAYDPSPVRIAPARWQKRGEQEGKRGGDRGADADHPRLRIREGYRGLRAALPATGPDVGLQEGGPDVGLQGDDEKRPIAITQVSSRSRSRAARASRRRPATFLDHDRTPSMLAALSGLEPPRPRPWTPPERTVGRRGAPFLPHVEGPDPCPCPAVHGSEIQDQLPSEEQQRYRQRHEDEVRHGSAGSPGKPR